MIKIILILGALLLVASCASSIKNSNNSSTDSNTNDFLSLLESSTLDIFTHRIFMHYEKDDLTQEVDDSEWRNQSIFFWEADEPFENKSLPPLFKSFPEYLFYIEDLPKDYSLNSGEVAPWFGMKGHGTKYFVDSKGTKKTFKNLNSIGVLNYIEQIKLTNTNTEILKNKDEYFFVLISKEVTFKNNQFQHNNKIISISNAYKHELISIAKLAIKI